MKERICAQEKKGIAVSVTAEYPAGSRNPAAPDLVLSLQAAVPKQGDFLLRILAQLADGPLDPNRISMELGEGAPTYLVFCIAHSAGLVLLAEFLACVKDHPRRANEPYADWRRRIIACLKSHGLNLGVTLIEGIQKCVPVKR